MRATVAAVLVACVASLVCSSAWAAPAPAALIETVKAPALQVDGAHSVRNVTLSAGAATITLDDGLIVPAQPLGDRPIEFAFVGKGSIKLTPPDDVERRQFVLFTTKEQLDTPCEEMVLVVGDPKLVERLLSGDKAADPTRTDAAKKLFNAWTASAERSRSGLRGMLLRGAMGEPTFAGLLAAWTGPTLANGYLLLLEPEEAEPIRVRRFEPKKLTEAQRFELEGQLAVAQGQGHALNADLDHWGTFDTWTSVGMTPPSPIAGFDAPGVVPEHYVLDVDLTGSAGRLDAKTTLRLRAQRDDVRTVKLNLFSDLVVARIVTSGQQTPFFQEGQEVVVFLPAAVGRGALVEMSVEYSGAVLQKLRHGLYTSWSTTGWYPTSGEWSAATYEATFHYPTKLTLFAPGNRVDGGEKDGARWDRYTLDAPAPLYGFELGTFDVEEGQAGHIKIRVAFCKETQSWLGDEGRQKLVKNVEAILSFFERTFGRYPKDELTIVTTTSGGVRDFSQAFPGLVTLLDVELRLGGKGGILEGVVDYRMVLAHEIAHQWWGAMVRPASYHDVWLSEGMAQYAALLMGREIVHQGKEFVSPTRWSWEELRGRHMANGWPAEWAGPVVLGWRLESSKCRGCYSDIVYTKGAMVLETLGALVGEEDLVAALRRLVQDRQGRPLSTPEFIRFVQARGQQDLGWFDAQFVRGVGMPVIVYRYDFARGANSGWVVNIHLDQVPDYGVKKALVHRDDGTWDLERRRDEFQVGLARKLTIPLQLAYFKPEDGLAPGSAAERKAHTLGNFGRRSAVSFEGVAADIPYRLDFEPRQCTLNPDESMALDVYDATMNPKKSRLVQAQERFDAGDLDQAEKLAQEARSATVSEERREFLRAQEVARSLREGGVRSVAHYQNERMTYTDVGETVWSRMQDLRADALLAEVQLARGKLPEAADALKMADKLTDGTRDPGGVDVVETVRARILLRQNKANDAYKVLWKQVMDGGKHPADAWALMALTAHLKGEKDVLDKALKHLDDEAPWIDVAAIKK